MAIRTINSAGVEIKETDLSVFAPQNVGTTVFITGFAAQGPSDEVIKITSKDDLDSTYGIPTNSSERYFYHGIKELLNSSANIYSFRLPYGANTGSGFGSMYSALAYPVQTYTGGAVTSNLSVTPGIAAVYVLGEPVHVTLNEDQYNQALEGTLFAWTSGAAAPLDLDTSLSALGGAGVIVLNKSQTTINAQFEGYYLGISDNVAINPATNYNSIIQAKSISTSALFVSGGAGGSSSYTTIPSSILSFNLSAAYNGPTNSVSQILENITTYNVDSRYEDDFLNLAVFKLRKSIYSTEAFKLDYVVSDTINGSIDSFRNQLNPNGGLSVPYFLENVDNNATNIQILVNPYISNKYSGSSQNASGLPLKKIRVLTNDILINNDQTKSGITTVALSTISGTIGFADSLYPLGAYTDVQITQKILGDIPSKLDRALQSVINDEIYDIDVVAEAGLGTIYAMSRANLSATYYDETLYNTALSGVVQKLRTSSDISSDTVATGVRADYTTIFNKFESFCNLPGNTGGRGDCIFIADILRHIVVTGNNSKVLADRTKNFQSDIYWAIRHQFELVNTSYAAVYGNWAQTYDSFIGQNVWVPFSSVAAGIFAKNDSMEFPWSAPAGYTRGLVSSDVIDIAITPNQKQRDDLYKSNINPVLFSASQGIAVFGQKTLSRKPSAFDRINVRRCFLALERPTKKASVFFVFEPNNVYTRTRFVNTLTPIFEYAKQNGGVYDYLIVCDERNNSAEVIDNNELRADIYLKPTRTGEFIVVSFYATRTDANFKELAG